MGRSKFTVTEFFPPGVKQYVESTVARGITQGIQRVLQSPRTPSKTPINIGRPIKVDRMKIDTPRKTNTVSVKKMGAMASRSAGFFKKGSKKFKKKRLVKVQKKNGVNHTVEINSFVTGVDACWIGHATFARQMLYKQAVKVLFLHLMKATGVDFTSSDYTFASEIANGAKIAVDYRLAPESASATQLFEFQALQRSCDNFVAWWFDTPRPWNGSDEVQFLKMYWAEGVNAEAAVELNNFLFDFAIKSTLKIQNRTKNVDGTDSTDESDVVPLYGKSYNARGNNLKTRKDRVGSSGTANIVNGDALTGVVTAFETDRSMKEPPQGYVEFSNVKSVGKAHLDPGQIKTSVLTHSFKMYLNTLQNRVGETPSASDRYARNIGVMRVFCMEKMINTLTDPVNNILLAYEHNYEVSVSGVAKRRFCLVKSFEKI